MESDILWALLRANIAASIAIAIILPARLYIRKVFGGRSAYTLWLLALTAAAASLLPARRVFIASGALSDQPPPGSGAALQGVAGDGAAGAIADIPLSLNAEASVFAVNWPAALLFIWIAGALIAAGFIAWRQFRFVKSLGRLEVDRIAELCVLRSQQPSAGPALMGIFRPSIVLPPDFETRFNEEERALIIAHERMHVAAGDAAVNFLIAAALCLCWFNPLVHVAARFIRSDQEIACDTDVIAHFPGARRTYAQALFKTQLSADAAPLGCAWPAPSVHPLKERIEIVGNAGAERGRRRTGMILAALVALAGGAVAWAAQAPVIIVAAAPQTFAAAGDSRPAFPSDRTWETTGPGVDLIEIAARLTVIAENRPDYAIDITPSADLPEPTVRKLGDRLIVDGGLSLTDDPCQTRFDGNNLARLPGVGSFRARDLPEIVIRAPLDADITVDGAVITDIGPTRTGRFENHGCGDMQIAAASGRLEASLYGYGDVVIDDLAAPVKASLVGIGNMRLGDMGDATLDLIGIGKITTGKVDGALTSLLHGAGDISVESVRAGADLTLSGAGDFDIDDIRGTLGIDIGGSGAVRIGAVDSETAGVIIPGSGIVEISNGRIGEFTIYLTGSGGVRFGGEARVVNTEFDPGAPDIFIARAGKVNARRNRAATGSVILGREM